MNTLHIVFQVICLAWFLSEAILSIFFRSRSADPQKDKHSLRYIWMSIALAVPSAVWLSKATSVPISASSMVLYLGLILILLGAAIRWWSIGALGKFFTPNLACDKGHQLVDKGPYALVRHPSYTGSLLSFLGFGLALNNWVSLVVIFTLVPAAFLYRIRLEEKMMEEEMGEVYRGYQSRTKKLIPFVY